MWPIKGKTSDVSRNLAFICTFVSFSLLQSWKRWRPRELPWRLRESTCHNTERTRRQPHLLEVAALVVASFWWASMRKSIKFLCTAIACHCLVVISKGGMCGSCLFTEPTHQRVAAAWKQPPVCLHENLHCVNPLCRRQASKAIMVCRHNAVVILVQHLSLLF